MPINNLDIDLVMHPTHRINRQSIANIRIDGFMFEIITDVT